MSGIQQGLLASYKVAPTGFVPSANTLIYYKLDGDALDSSGNSNDGTETSVSYVTGQINEAGSFNGTSSIITSNSAITLNATFTISFWFKTSATAYTGFIGSWGLALTPDVEILFDMNSGGNNGDIRPVVQGTNGMQASTSFGTGLNDNIWHNVIYVCNSTTQTTYIDGTSAGTTSINMGNVNTGTLIGVGGCYYDNATVGNYGNTLIDEVIIENVARNSTEASNMFNTQNW